MAEEKEQDLLTDSGAKWYFKWWAVFLAFLFAGPLCLILVWIRPRTHAVIKILLSVLVIAVTLWISAGVAEYYRKMVDYYMQLQQEMKGV